MTGSELHEPKGVASATSEQVYLADGAGSGAWTTFGTHHATMTGAELHEPKGASTATASQVYVADGAASGAWTDTEDLNTKYCVSCVIADVSTSETVYVPIPHGGTVDRITVVLEGAITGTDPGITIVNPGVGTIGTITIDAGTSAAGTVDALIASSNNTVTDDDYITVATDGASTTAQRLWVNISINQT